ncbi:MAG: nicotinate-nucleotide--dimethylbenzimidazole phosphoribosyltransferase [Saprospiraceae bacterium]|nr:nicotinate-nucleotide--dimethylbenzimidazole phosphoribosyltransferase [Saprospiraceae bacterium]
MKQALQQKIDFKTKPLGALGRLEKLALQIGVVQNTLTPQLRKPTILVFAADHGIAREGVSAYPQEVTYQMVMNFLQGGAAINVFCRQNGVNLKVIDAGVNFDFEKNRQLIDAKIAHGTHSFLHTPAMTAEQVTLCFEKSKNIVTKVKKSGCNVIGFGEMGIGNTSSAAILMHLLTHIPLTQCVGRGTGLDDKQFVKKVDILQNALDNQPVTNDPLPILTTFGGFEIAQICGGMLAAFEQNMLILVDGFIASSAFLVAHKINPNIIENAVFCHLSDEFGHKNMLNYLNVEPILNLQMRLGEGTGCAVAYPIIKSAVEFLNTMASFDSAGVSNK